MKALKLLLKDVQVVEGKKGGKISRDVELDDDDGDEEWDDDDPLEDVDPVDEFGYLSCEFYDCVKVPIDIQLG